MGSATWVCISAAVAPGQIAETFTTLTVKNGSSARPSRWYEKKPAAPSATIRNRMSAGWLTAQPERLKRFIASAPAQNGDDDIVGLVGFDGDRLQRDLTLVIDDVERGIAAFAEQRRQGQPRHALGFG